MAAHAHQVEVGVWVGVEVEVGVEVVVGVGVVVGRVAAMTANTARAAVGNSGTVKLPSTAAAGRRLTVAAAANACLCEKPHNLPAAKSSQVARMAMIALARRPTSSDGSSTFITVPVAQNGNGNQLVPLGSSVAWPAKRCAMVTLA